MDAFTPPSWSEKGVAKFILGTDGQGRDMLSTILYGSRISLIGLLWYGASPETMNTGYSPEQPIPFSIFNFHR